MDPHDQMMLANRPTTVVTQGTTLLDQMPTPYGDQGDEESMFAGIGSDSTMGRSRGQRPVQLADDAAPGGAAQLSAPSQSKTGVVIGLGVVLGLSMLGFFKAKRR